MNIYCIGKKSMIDPESLVCVTVGIATGAGAAKPLDCNLQSPFLSYIMQLLYFSPLSRLKPECTQLLCLLLSTSFQPMRQCVGAFQPHSREYRILGA